MDEIDDRRLRRMIEIRRPPGVGYRIGSYAGGIVRRAVEQADRLEQAAQAWLRSADPGWGACTSVEAVDGDEVVVGVRNGALLGELRRRAGALSAAVRAHYPRCRRIRFVPLSGATIQEETGGQPDGESRLWRQP